MKLQVFLRPNAELEALAILFSAE